MAEMGTTVVGRNVFGGETGPRGRQTLERLVGESPPYHHPVFVLTHHPRERLVLEGGTTLTRP